MAVDPDWEWEFIDGSYVKVHQRAGAASQESQTEDQKPCRQYHKDPFDDYGLPIESEIAGGEINDCFAAPDLIAKLPEARAIIAD